MSEGEGRIGVWSAISIGLGGMVGGGIFAILGLAATLAMSTEATYRLVVRREIRPAS